MNTDREGQIKAALKLGIDLKNKDKIEMLKIFKPDNDNQYSVQDAQNIVARLSYEDIRGYK